MIGRVAIGLAATGLGALGVAAADETMARPAGLSGAGLLSAAWIAALAMVWRHGRPIGMRGGLRLRKETNPTAYGLSLALVGALGLLPIALIVAAVLLGITR